MSSWIDFSALWKIVVVGLLAGAGLPALFAVGIRLLAVPAHHLHAVADGGAEAGAAAGATGMRFGRNPAADAVAVVCFAIVLAAIGYGIYLIVNG